MNTSKLFNEFMARPMRSDPDEISENLMRPERYLKMSKRDKARLNFVNKHRRRQEIKNSIKEIIQEERDFIRSVQTGQADF